MVVKQYLNLEHADDSSDEEFIDDTLLENREAIQERFREFTSPYDIDEIGHAKNESEQAIYSFLLHQAGMALLYSKEVSKEYYTLKKKDFLPSQLREEQDKLISILRNAFKETLKLQHDDDKKKTAAYMVEFDSLLKREPIVKYFLRCAFKPSSTIDIKVILLQGSCLHDLTAIRFSGKDLVQYEEKLQVVSTEEKEKILDELRKLDVTFEKDGVVKFQKKKTVLKNLKKSKNLEKPLRKILTDAIDQKARQGTDVDKILMSSKNGALIPGILKEVFLGYILKLKEKNRVQHIKGKKIKALYKYEFSSDTVSALPEEEALYDLLEPQYFWNRFLGKIRKKLKNIPWIQRGEYQNKGIYETANFFQFLVMLRVFNRDFKRKLKTLSEVAIDKKILRTTIIRQWKSFGGAPVSELEKITENGARLDYVNDITSYP